MCANGNSRNVLVSLCRFIIQQRKTDLSGEDAALLISLRHGSIAISSSHPPSYFRNLLWPTVNPEQRRGSPPRSHRPETTVTPFPRGRGLW